MSQSTEQHDSPDKHTEKHGDKHPEKRAESPKLNRNSRFEKTLSISRLMSKRDSKRNSLIEKPRFSGDLYCTGPDEKLKKPSREETFHIQHISNKLTALGIPPNEDRILRILRGGYANGSANSALDLYRMWEDASAGIIKEWSADVTLKGAENNGKVTCYLDSVLFSLYAHLDSFEAMLYNVFDDDKRKKLSSLLRLFVNMLRSGKLITVDIIQEIQNSLADCGWKEAAFKQQQDASEAFNFIAETLEMPLLTLKMDIAHGGLDIPDDDHKFINERLLNIAIPSEAEDSGPITLERCLEEYFNNRVDVQRKLEQRAVTASAADSLLDPLLFDEKSHIDEKSPLDEKPTLNGLHIEYADLGSAPATPSTPVGPRTLERKSSLLRTIESNSKSATPKTRRRAQSVRKEITIPAWQFFNLLPFYTDAAGSDKDRSTTKSSFANHFSSKRPIIGLCLKRYTWSAAGTPIRNGTEIKIPTEIELPHFVGDDDMEDSGNFRLLLQSAVCHRGTTTNSGHYISLVRTDDDKWLRFDDLAKERITEVDRTKAFAEESPYLLFYQVQAMEGPPPYEEVDSSRSSQEESRGLPTFDYSVAEGADGYATSASSSPVQEPQENGEALQGRYSLDAAQQSKESLRPSSRPERRSEDLTKTDATSRSLSRSTENRLSFAGLSRLAVRISREKEDGASTNGNGSAASSIDGDREKPEGKTKKDKGKAKEQQKKDRRRSRRRESDDDKECVIQ
ncbi:hypothetical protein H072_8673 [Dactylellina haptotyla CBS 200.50]|uniref:ubiquitinyl hydrolase 1 n=1 Tax=Dactylellina haptotyla (strain CBS 200.50) TaxID=1284197 RepID=S8BED4_DACHA|nr:hypothetical protein H072_8673 [Dactylellina haptotyla CBS 200.50]